MKKPALENKIKEYQIEQLKKFDKKFKDFPGGLYIKLSKSVDTVAHEDDIKDFIKNYHNGLIKLIHKDIKKHIDNFELDAKAHSQGRCSYSSMALCSAEEQKTKMYFYKLLKEIK